MSIPIDFSSYGLSQAAAWNYLREEITVGLIRRREVRIGHIFDRHDQLIQDHEQLPNRISYILARVMNFCFGRTSLEMSVRARADMWRSLNSDVLLWKDQLPRGFEPFSSAGKSSDPFPSLWMLRPWHGTY